MYQPVQRFPDQRNPVQEAHFRFGALPSSADPQIRQVIGQCADVRRDTHLIVVQHDDHFGFAVPRVVERFIAHSAGQCAVPDDGDHLIFFFPVIPGAGHAERGRNRGACVTRLKTVVFALAPFRKTGDAAVGTQRGKTVIPSGDHLVYIALMSDVKNDLVFRHMKDPVERECKLHNAEIGRKMTAVFGNGGNQFTADFSGKLLQLGMAHAVQIARRMDLFKHYSDEPFIVLSTLRPCFPLLPWRRRLPPSGCRL